MANALAAAFKLAQLGDDATSGFTVADLETDVVTAYLVDSADDTMDATGTTDQDLADLAAAARVANANLAGKALTQASGTLTFDANDTTFSAVSGDQSEHIYLFKNTGVEATSLWLVKFDTFTSGMPVTPSGGDIVVVWHASGIFTW